MKYYINQVFRSKQWGTDGGGGDKSPRAKLPRGRNLGGRKRKRRKT